MRGSTFARIALAAGAALIATFGVTGPAYANDTVPLNDGQKNKTAANFTSSCENVPVGSQPGTDGWVFVLPGSGGPNGSEFVSLTLTFKDTSNAEHTVVINASGATIDGQTVKGGLITKANAEDTSKAWVEIPLGWTLVSGTSQVTSGDHGDFFNVTHVCRGTQTSPSPSPSGSSSSSHSESSSSSGSASGSSSSAAGGGGGLPTTGTKIGVLVGVGLALVAGGVGLVALRRRRDIVVTPDGS